MLLVSFRSQILPLENIGEGALCANNYRLGCILLDNGIAHRVYSYDFLVFVSIRYRAYLITSGSTLFQVIPASSSSFKMVPARSSLFLDLVSAFSMAASDIISSFVYMLSVKPLSANPTKWLNKLKQM